MHQKPQCIDVREYRFEDDGSIPNNPTLPLLVYPQVLAEHERDPSRCKELLAENGWGGAWVDGVFPYHHYHSTSHEVLCVVGGRARITFGGPEGETVEVRVGDVAVVPAGVGHCRESSGGAFSVVGAYPRGHGELRPAHRRRGRATGSAGEHPQRSAAGSGPPLWWRGPATHALVRVAIRRGWLYGVLPTPPILRGGAAGSGGPRRAANAGSSRSP